MATTNVPSKHVTVGQYYFKADSADWMDHQIAAGNKTCKNLSTAVIPLFHNMVQNKVIILCQLWIVWLQIFQK
jgi:hypothetical protein